METEFVFQAIFKGVFNYDAKYGKISFQQPTFDILAYPVEIREVFYRYYPELLSKHPKLGKVFNKTMLMNTIEKDDALPYIPMYLVPDEDIKTREFHKLFEEDYKFQQLTTVHERKHFMLTKAIRYDIEGFKGLNVDLYLSRNLISIKQLAFTLDAADIKWVAKWYAKYKDVNKCFRRFTDEKCSTFNPEADKLFNIDYVKTFDEKFANLLGNSANVYELKSALADKIIKSTEVDSLTDGLLLRYCSPELLTRFDYSNQQTTVDVLKYRLPSDDVAPELIDKICNNKFSDEGFALLLDRITLTSRNCCAITRVDFTRSDDILSKYPDYCTDWFESSIRNEQIGPNNFNELWSKWSTHVKCPAKLAFAWIETYKREPPFVIYVSPNDNVDGLNTASVWRMCVNRDTVPIEMTNYKYWEYMHKTDGNRKNPEHSTCYTFFSNSLENKIVFTQSNVELTEPAHAEFSIPVPYKELKRFLHWELKTDDICLFAQMTKDDWNKVAGGRDDIDIVAFSDTKNIFRHRTPMMELMTYIIAAIEIKFGINVTMHEDDTDDDEAEATDNTDDDN